MSNEHKEAITLAMQILLEEFGDKFKVTPSRARVWSQMLKEFDKEAILAAAYHLASTEEWAPPIAKMRKACIELTHGELVTLPAPEAWSRVLQYLQGREVDLGELEMEAMHQTGSAYDLKRSTSPGLDRAHFLKAYNGLVAKRDKLRSTLPEVREFAQSHAPQLPPKANPHRELPEPAQQPSQPVDPQWLEELLTNTVRSLQQPPEWTENTPPAGGDNKGERT